MIFENIFEGRQGRPLVGVNFSRLAKIRSVKKYEGNLPLVYENELRIDWDLYGRILEAKNEQLIRQEQIN